MKILIQTVISSTSVPPMAQAKAVAEHGFHGFVAGEHHHYPINTPVPEFYQETGVPEFYKYVPEPFTILGAVSGTHPDFIVGTGIILVPIHDALMLANRIATLDWISGGKTFFACGVGWNEPELANHGLEFATRNEKLVETIKAMKKAWAADTAAFSGQFVNFTESWVGPKPIQKPHPPLLLGGRPLKKNFERIAEVFDGWMPTDTYAKTFGGDLDGDLDRLRGMVAAAGRDPAALHNSFLYAELMLYDRDPAKYALDAPTREELELREKQGFKSVVIGVPTFSDAHLQGALDHLAKVAAPWLS
jgi:probable F420-dependent oxidoreductase